MITLLAIAAVVFCLTLWRPVAGVAAVIVLWPAYLLRTTIFQVPTTALELGVYAAVAAVVVLLVSRRMDWPKMRWSRWWMAAILLTVAAWFVSSVLAVDRQAGLGAWKAWAVDPLLFTGVLLVAVRTNRDRLWVAAAAVISGVIVAGAGFAQLIWFRETVQDGRLSSFFHPVANYAAMYLAPLAVLAWSLVLQAARFRAWWLTGALVLSVALALTVSFGGLLSLAVGLAVAWWFMPSGNAKRWTAIIGLVLAAAGMVGLQSTHYFDEHFQPGRSSGAVRQQIWGSARRIISDHPLFGVGLNNFEPAYRKAAAILYWPPLEWEVTKAHNLYLNAWAETGIFGLAGLLALCILAVIGAGRLLRQPATRLWAIVSCAGLAAILVHGFVDTPVFKNDLALLFVFMIALPYLGRDDIPEKKN